MGASTYGLVRNLVQPLKPKDKTFREIVSILQAHFEPKPLMCDFGASLDESLLSEEALTFA